MRSFWVYSIARIGKQEAWGLGFLSLMTWAVPAFREWSRPNEGSVEVKDPYLLGLIQEVQDEERLNRKNAQEGKAFFGQT